MDLKKEQLVGCTERIHDTQDVYFFEVVAFIEGIQYEALAGFSEITWLSCNVFISPLQRPFFGNFEQENTNL
jgi:hypothetical protein